MRPTADTSLITMSPVGAALTFRAGQFAFIRFPQVKGLDEPHPFSLTSHPSEPNLSLRIKVNGDFTNRLQNRLKNGTKALVDGSYGRFDNARGGARQVWIAGGVGITPFLSWLKTINNSSLESIDLFYSLRKEEEDFYSGDLREYSSSNDFLRIHPVYTENDGHLSVDEIRARGVLLEQCYFYLCGPEPMVLSIEKQLKENGVPDKRIHYELFKFR